MPRRYRALLLCLAWLLFAESYASFLEKVVSSKILETSEHRATTHLPFYETNEAGEWQLSNAKWTKYPLTSADFVRSYSAGRETNCGFKKLSKKIRSGQPVKIAVFGCSVTKGTGCRYGNSPLLNIFFLYFTLYFTPPNNIFALLLYFNF
jgi:hypothetical protein